MKKEYSVNIRYAHSDDDWEAPDYSDWFTTWADAFWEAEKAFDNPEVLEVMFAEWEDGEIEDFPLHMVRENGQIHQYKNGQLLWL